MGEHFHRVTLFSCEHLGTRCNFMYKMAFDTESTFPSGFNATDIPYIWGVINFCFRTTQASLHALLYDVEISVYA